MSRGYHIPVMLKETIDSLVQKRDGRYIDCTAGGGGHCSEILRRIDDSGLLVAIDRDDDAIKVLNERFGAKSNVLIVQDDFGSMGEIASITEKKPFDGILMDFGVSSYQIDTADRGFSFSMSGPLDMRMDRENYLTAEHVVNNYSPQNLTRVLREFGEVGPAGKLAKAIMSAGPLSTTDDLVKVVEKGLYGKHRVKMLAKVFQAVRIEVNGELDAIRDVLEASFDLLGSGGRIVTLSYHSLEDRIVKQFVKKKIGKKEVDPFSPIQIENENKAEVIDVFRGVVKPSDSEAESNPRARSAKMRVIEKV